MADEEDVCVTIQLRSSERACLAQQRQPRDSGGGGGGLRVDNAGVKQIDRHNQPLLEPVGVGGAVAMETAAFPARCLGHKLSNGSSDRRATGLRPLHGIMRSMDATPRCAHGMRTGQQVVQRRGRGWWLAGDGGGTVDVGAWAHSARARLSGVGGGWYRDGGGRVVGGCTVSGGGRV